MDTKTIFLNSLYDEQMGFFCAHEYSENLEELLKDELNGKQFNLFKEWKDSEKTPITNDCNVALDLLAKKLDRIETIFEKLTVRLEAIKENQTPQANTPIPDVVAPMYERISGIEKVLGEIMTRFDATEKKTNKAIDRTSNVVEPIVNRIDGMEKVLEKIMNRLEQTEKDTNKSALEQNKKTEVFQENLLTRMKEIEQCVKQSKDVRNSGNSGKPVNEIVLPTRRTKKAIKQIRDDMNSLLEHNETIEASQANFSSVLDDTDQNVKKVNRDMSSKFNILLERTRKIEPIQETVNKTKPVLPTKPIRQVEHQFSNVTIKKEPKKEEKTQQTTYFVPLQDATEEHNPFRRVTTKVKHTSKTVLVPRIQMLDDYIGPGIFVQKGEILGLLDDCGYLVKVGGDGKIGFVPRAICKEIGGLIEVRVPF